MYHAASALLGILLTLTGISSYDTASDIIVGADPRPFTSKQLAPNPANGNCLTTDGSINAWSSDCGDGGGGSSGGGLASSTPWIAGYLAYVVNNSTVRGVATTSLTASSPLSLSQPISVIGSSASAVSIQNAAADGSTKGAASFTANDFNSSSGNISIDYTNGTAATAGTKGFLTATDWTTFNGKESALTFNSPLVRSTNTITCPTCATFGYPFLGNATTTGLGIYASTTIGNGTTAGGLTISGGATTTSLKITGLTGNRLVSTNSQGLLGTSITLAQVVSSISDVSGSTGSTNFVLSASPTLTGLTTMANASSTLFSSAYASSTDLRAGRFTFGGVTGDSWDDFCTAITGSSGLCDGADDSGGGSSFDYPFPNNATSTLIDFENGLNIATTSQHAQLTIAASLADPEDIATGDRYGIFSNAYNFSDGGLIHLQREDEASDFWLSFADSQHLRFNVNTDRVFSFFTNAEDGYSGDNILTLALNESSFNSPLIVNAGATTSSLGVLDLTAEDCDVKSTTDGSLFCGIDATGGGSSFDYLFPNNATSTAIDFSGGLTAASTTVSGTSTTARLNVTGAVSILGEYFTNFTTYVRSLFTGGQGINLSGGTLDFDCSEVEGTGINCSGENITLDATGDWTGTFDGVEGSVYAQATGDTYSGTHDFSGASVKQHTYASFSYSTSTAWTGTTTIPLGPAYTAEAFNGVKCTTDTGTLNIRFGDGTNYTNMFNASTTVGSVGLSGSNTFTASEKREVQIGTPASSPTKISCTVDKTVNN
jgi:hypothetical protein